MLRGLCLSLPTKGMLDLSLGCCCLLADCRGADRSIEEVRTKMALLLATGLVILFDWFIATNPLFEFIINFATLSNSSFLSSKVIKVNSFLVQRHVSSIISLLIAEDLWIELFLPLLESINFGSACIDWFGHASLRLPVCVCTEASFISFTIIVNWSLFFIATSEYAGLELLVLLVLSIETGVSVHTLRRRRCVGWLHLGIFPVTSSTHEAAISFLSVGTVLHSWSSMDLPRFQIIGIKIRCLFPLNLFWSGLHDFVLGALDEFLVGVSEEVHSARVPSADTLPARIFNDWISKHIAVEGILSPFLGLLRTWRMEDRTLIGILLPCFCLTLWFAFRSLDGSNVCGLRAENVWILVWSSSDFRSQWVVFENALTLFDLSWSSLVVWFEMEHVASICVGVALFRVSSVVNYVLVWVADQVSAVFSLLEVSCFCHWVIFC